MALQIHHLPSSLTKNSYRHPYSIPLLLFRTRTSKSILRIQCQKPTTDETTAANKSTPPAPGQGFGSSSASPSPKSSPNSTNKKKQKGKRERASIIRRSPVEKPAFVAAQQDDAKAKEQSKNESAFLLTWLGLGGIILVEGILLAASGFLPEEWDNFFVKYLYPSFTPTVFLFVAGTVAYGVSKYLQNEKLKDQK